MSGHGRGALPPLRSPEGGAELRHDTAHSLSDGTRRWPVVDGIPYLRTGREALAAQVLALLDSGAPNAALALLLADQDGWWTGPTATAADLARLVRERDRLSLRQAMGLLQWGPVADYFAHRWSDPTFLAGLALAGAHWTAPRTGFELACGIGHHLRAMAQQGVQVVGADIVFAKLWVARHWVAPEATLLCFDAASPWPLREGAFDLVCCHDAFYFLEPKQPILASLRALAAGGTLLVGHVHNRDWPNWSAGSALSAAEFAALLPDAVLYDDAELTQALLQARAPVPATPARLATAEAFAAVAGRGAATAAALEAGIAMPPPGARLRRNPLYDTAGRIAWPSERYRAEYAPRASYPAQCDAPSGRAAEAAMARRRELVDLPERW